MVKQNMPDTETPGTQVTESSNLEGNCMNQWHIRSHWVWYPTPLQWQIYQWGAPLIGKQIKSWSTASARLSDTQTPWTDNVSFLLFSALVKAKPLTSTVARQKLTLTDGQTDRQTYGLRRLVTGKIETKSSGSPEFFKKHSPPCAPWCILRLSGAYCAFLVHK